MIKKVESGYKVKQTGKYKMKKETHIYVPLIYNRVVLWSNMMLSINDAESIGYPYRKCGT